MHCHSGGLRYDKLYTQRPFKLVSFCRGRLLLHLADRDRGIWETKEYPEKSYVAAFDRQPGRYFMGLVHRMAGLVGGFFTSPCLPCGFMFYAGDRQSEKAGTAGVFVLLYPGRIFWLDSPDLSTGLVQVTYPSVICGGVSFLMIVGLFIFKRKELIKEFHKKLRM